MNNKQLLKDHDNYLDKVEGLREFISEIQKEIDQLLIPEKKDYH